MMPERSTIDAGEVERFARLAETWWDPRGEMKPLHAMNPARLRVIRDAMLRRFGRDPGSGRPFEGLAALDVGCGGGLACEPLARLGATVTGIDPAAENVGVARAHAAAGGLSIDYRATTAEALLASGERFDVVLALEVVEHVADLALFLETCAGLVRPGGLLVVATINRTAKAFAFAIVGAEYVLGWLPRGTHSYDRLVRPEELAGPLRAAGLREIETVGIAYDPFGDRWRTSRDTDVNYMAVFERAGGTRPSPGEP
jgi:2-polyprenyl-6-hydroxyphenyl methylase/3-demethylubiquinone-9 3-methyltransferase